MIPFKVAAQRIIALALFLWIPAYAGMTGGVFAAETNDSSFASSYDVTYDIGDDGVTMVTEHITLRNLTNQYYATQFALTIGATQITDVSASNASGPMEVTTEPKGNATKLSVKFNQQIAGLNKTNSLTLNFKSKDFANLHGKIWEVSVPKVVSSENLDKYNLAITIPPSFGELSLISPNPKTQTTAFGKKVLTFDKSQLTESGVSATFGTSQQFDFKIDYHLQNSNFLPNTMKINLPPDTAFQEINYQEINPKPINVTIDNDGNYLAWYRLARYQKLDVEVTGSAKLNSYSRVKDPVLDASLVKVYTSAGKYWEKDNAIIKTKLSEILGGSPPSNNIEKAKLIHRFVSSYLRFDPSRTNDVPERYGAVTALNNPDKATCLEYTDLFIALSRAAGIPTRELSGFAYSSNPNLRPSCLAGKTIHVWPEFYDKDKGWVAVDPTWESTTGGVDYFNKLDLNHLVFSIKGLNEKPLLPSYTKVSFSGSDLAGKPSLEVTVDAPMEFLAGFPGKIKVTVFNNGNSLRQSSAFSVSANRLLILEGGSNNLGPIPSFGKASFDYNVRTKSLIEDFKENIEVTVGGEKFVKEVSVRPFIIFQGFPYVLIGIVSLIVLVYGVVLGGFLYRRRFTKRK